MIRAISLFITILLLAGSASATPLPASELLFYMQLHEVSDAGIRGFTGKYTSTFLQETKINISFSENVATDFFACGTRPCKISYTLTDLPFERARAPITSTGDRFAFDTIADCDPLGGTAFEWAKRYTGTKPDNECFDQAWTQYSFGGSWAPVNGLEVNLLHTLSPIDKVETSGSVIFSVNRDITYILSGSYGVEGDGISRLSYATQLLELRLSEPREGDTFASDREWFYLVNETGGFWQTGEFPNKEFSNVEYTFGDTTECWGCPEGENQYFGVLKARTPENKTVIYRLAWSSTVWRHTDATSDVEPTGHLSFVVPEPSTNLMGFAGILGLIVMGRRRHLKAKVS